MNRAELRSFLCQPSKCFMLGTARCAHKACHLLEGRLYLSLSPVPTRMYGLTILFEKKGIGLHPNLAKHQVYAPFRTADPNLGPAVRLLNSFEGLR